MKIVMIFGTFDIVHHGHLNLFKQARKYGDRLIAVVARDARVKNIKSRRSVYNEKERKYFLEQIRLIDKVVLGDSKDVYKRIKEIKPDSIVLGYDQMHFTEKLEEKIQEFKLKTKVVRAKAYKSKTLKTGKIRKVLETKI
jgi:cytidyltransferase-like protein